MAGIHSPVTMTILRLLIILILMPIGVTVAASDKVPRLTLVDMEETHSLKGHWQFRPGDDFSWAAASYDDSAWEKPVIHGNPAHWGELTPRTIPHLTQDDRRTDK